MTVHDHREFVEGCYRCDLSRDEVTEYTPTTADADMRAIIVSFAENATMLAEEFGLTVTVTPDEVVAGFDLWLSAHDAEVAAKALEDAADAAEMTSCPCSYSAAPGRFCIQPSHHAAHAHAVQLRARATALRASTGGENRG